MIETTLEQGINTYIKELGEIRGFNCLPTNLSERIVMISSILKKSVMETYKAVICLGYMRYKTKDKPQSIEEIDMMDSNIHEYFEKHSLEQDESHIAFAKTIALGLEYYEN